jgi:CBS domain-containing protein
LPHADAEREAIRSTIPAMQGGNMDNPLKNLEELLPYRTIKQILAARPGDVHTASPTDTAVSALKSMAEKWVGFLVVLEGGKLVGVLSERDFGRKVVLAGRAVEDTLVSDIMTREIITVTPGHRFGDCLQLMERHGIRHLPVVDGGRVVGVVSGRDLMREAIAHYKKVIKELELERMTIFNSPV